MVNDCNKRTTWVDKRTNAGILCLPEKTNKMEEFLFSSYQFTHGEWPNPTEQNEQKFPLKPSYEKAADSSLLGCYTALTGKHLPTFGRT
jgi:hypothetical protein